MPNSPQNVEPINITNQDALGYVKGALADECVLGVSAHAKERMLERDISITQVRAVLKQGMITESPTRDTSGRWSCRFEGYAAGEGLGVVVGFKFVNGARVVVVTAFHLNNYHR